VILPPAAADLIVERLATLLRAASPAGDTEDALALAARRRLWRCGSPPRAR
jgi:hypothetical protein